MGNLLPKKEHCEDVVFLQLFEVGHSRGTSCARATLFQSLSMLLSRTAHVGPLRADAGRSGGVAPRKL